MVQLMPLPFTISCFSKIQIGFTFLVPGCHPDSALNGCVYVVSQLDEEMPALLVNWVPRKLAPQIRCVFTMIDGTPQHKALIEREPQPFSLQLTPLNDQDRQVCCISGKVELINSSVLLA